MQISIASGWKKDPIPSSDKPWLCTAKDFVWTKVKRKKIALDHLVVSYGLSVSQRHRALADCQIIAAVLDKVHSLDDLVQQAIRRSLERSS